MTPKEIRKALIDNDTSMAQIAREMNPPRSRSMVSIVVNRWRGSVSTPAMTAVAKAIGKDVKEVFPEYFLKKAVTK